MRIAKRIFKNSVLLVVALDETRIHNDDGHAVVDLERGLGSTRSCSRRLPARAHMLKPRSVPRSTAKR